MAKIRSSIQLQTALETDLAWRIQEIGQLRRMIASNSGIAERAVLRAALPILYAHWEGYIKTASCSYAVFLSSQGLKFEDILDCFMGMVALEHVKNIDGLKRRIFASSKIIQSLTSIKQEKVSLPIKDYIWKIGNLNYEMLEQIAGFLGIDLAPYANKANLIDESLLGQRNDIAHGENLEIDKKGYIDLSDEIINLMRSFKTDIENAVVMKSYLRAQIAADP